jgi:hypothetical protein
MKTHGVLRLFLDLTDHSINDPEVTQRSVQNHLVGYRFLCWKLSVQEIVQSSQRASESLLKTEVSLFQATIESFVENLAETAVVLSRFLLAEDTMIGPRSDLRSSNKGFIAKRGF